MPRKALQAFMACVYCRKVMAWTRRAPRPEHMLALPLPGTCQRCQDILLEN